MGLGNPHEQVLSRTPNWWGFCAGGRPPANRTQQIVLPGIPKLPTFRRTTPITPYQKRVYDLLQLSTP